MGCCSDDDSYGCVQWPCLLLFSFLFLLLRGPLCLRVLPVITPRLQAILGLLFFQAMDAAVVVDASSYLGGLSRYQFEHK